ncbi:DUF6777 domain-containing protein [Kitasatospora sp. NPDC088134]|uniref:DUF6777 domain-containing protein n=1 Tax=Kitasatospora sp. NPDC088134 TaxID=3364071 RepID=UPI003808E2ED
MLGTAAVVAGLGIALGVVLTGGAGDKDTKNVALQPVAAVGQEPFTGSVANAAATISPSAAAPGSGGATASSAAASGGTVSGGEPGLYGGTREVASCDVPKLSSYLTSNSDKARAWAGVEGIDSSQIDSYLHGLTPVLLRQDTRVTNHGFANGQATPYQAVLQSGTAVLVDNHGVPRVRCACGNPLLPPSGTGGTYSGTAWSSFHADGVVTVQPAPAPVTQIVLVDQSTGHQFGRPVGGSGGTDGSASPSAAGSSSGSASAPSSGSSSGPSSGPSSGRTGTGTPSGASSSAPSGGKFSSGSVGPSGSPASPGAGSAPASPGGVSGASGHSASGAMVSAPGGSSKALVSGTP